MTNRTLRRKLQKKIKRKPYRRCSKCGAKRCHLSLDVNIATGRPFLFKHCVKMCRAEMADMADMVSGKRTNGCGHAEELKAVRSGKVV